MKKNIFKLLLLMAFPFCVSAQNSTASNPKIDSLEKILLAKIHDTTRLNALNELGSLYKANSNYNLGLKKLNESIDLAQLIGNVKAEAKALIIRGNIYNIIRKHPEALSDLLAALKLREKEGNKKGMAAAYLGIGNTYSNMDNNEEALKYYNLSLKIREAINDKGGIASIYLGIGNVYIAKNDFPKALDSYHASLKIKTELGEKEGVEDAWNNIGVVHEMMGDFESALTDFYAALKIAEETNDKDAIAACYLNIAQANSYLNNTDEARKYYDKGLALAKEIGNLEWLKQGYSGVSALDTMIGNYKKAYQDYQLYINYRDSISDKTNTKKITQLQMQYDFDKQMEADKLIQEKKDAETAQAAFIQKIVIAGVSIVLIMVALFSVLLLKRIRITREQKHIIEEKNRDITDSINYAKRIQEVMLPPLENLHKLFPNSFVLFQPRDIVSGDFYWFAEKNDRRIIAAVDCTGHGVPGAFMSMIGNAFLNEIINEKGITSPELILNELRHMIIHALKQTGADGESRDGMDISIIVVDTKNSIVEYAGANNPLWYIKSDNEGRLLLNEIKADKRPIGYFRGQGLPFTLHTIPFKKGDSFYIFTDGYADQFGGQKGKKFKYSQLKEQILSIQNKSMSEQENVLLETFNNWKGHLEQIDDVLVIGVNT